uniref:Sec-independent protein translocase component TatC n=1 Tax=Labyrinthula sp. TaxID=1678526 RepID=A0A7S6U9Q6_9STRA|nr:Sec-independent protein translocase component TatC [Labyrinthula sp.]
MVYSNVREMGWRVRYVMLGYGLVVLSVMKEKGEVWEVLGGGGEGWYSMGVTEVWNMTIYVGMVVGLISVIPQVWVQLYVYVGKGMTGEERRDWKKVSMGGVGMVYGGAWVGWEYVIPRIKEFMERFGEDGRGIENVPMLGKQVEWMVKVELGVVLCMQIPVWVWVMRRRGWIRGNWGRGRRGVTMLLLVIGALGTPPEVTSQCMVYMPCAFLYEWVVWEGIRRKYRDKLIGISR